MKKTWNKVTYLSPVLNFVMPVIPAVLPRYPYTQKFPTKSTPKHCLRPFWQVLVLCTWISFLSLEIFFPTNTAALVTGGMFGLIIG